MWPGSQPLYFSKGVPLTLVPSTASAEVLVPVVQNKEWVACREGHLISLYRPTDRPAAARWSLALQTCL